MVRSAGLEPTPQASETKIWLAIALTIINIINALHKIKMLAAHNNINALYN